MRCRLKFLLVGGLCLAGVVGPSQHSAHSQGQTSPTVSPSDYLHWRTEFKNWGRWGPDDQLGTSNLITAEKVQDAASLVNTGVVISLAHAVPQTVAADVGENGLFRRTTNRIGDANTTDTYQVSYHGLTVAHMDAWCHFFFEGQMYNGYSVDENITPETGCKDGRHHGVEGRHRHSRCALRHPAIEGSRVG